MMAKEGEEDQRNSIYEARIEKMVSLKDGKLTLRTGRFLKPFAKRIELALKAPHNTHLSDCISHKRKVIFKGWRVPQEKWKEWIDKLSVKYGPVWKKTGIFDGIMCSEYDVRCNHDLIVGLLGFWCCETNTFVFPWGEASITLEDVMILGGLPVIGESVKSPLKGELVKIEKKLDEERLGVINLVKKKKKWGMIRSKSKKDYHISWLNHFMEKESELEHVAFISLWLSQYVFPCGIEDTVIKHVFPIAIRLSRGIRVALAPAVLASLYKNLRLLKEGATLENVVVSATFQLIQLWAFQHFPILFGSSLPNTLDPGDPRVARWHQLSCRITLPIVRSVLKLPENFEWRPYAANLKYWRHLAYHREAELVIPDCSSLDEELQSFIQCLWGCELIGIDSKEKYMPQRVAMQFGFDQDLPADNSGADFVCKDPAVIVPARAFEPGVSAQYFDWWKQSNDVMASSSREEIPSIYKRIAANETATKVEENDSPASAPSKSMKSPIKKSRVSTESNGEKLDAVITPEPPSNTSTPKVEAVSDDDNNARKRKWTATQGQGMTGDPQQVKKKNRQSMDDPIEITDFTDEIAKGKASIGSYSGKTKQGDRKKVGDYSCRPIDLDKHVETTSRSTTTQQPKLDLEERLAKLEKMMGLILP